MARGLLALLLLCTASAAANSIDDWTQKCNKCKCLWSNGRKTANCTSIGFSDIPQDLSSEIREIDFSNNPVHYLRKNVLFQAHLRDVHKLKFVNCNLSTLDDDAFKGLQLLIELDLSRNSIGRITPRTFKPIIKLRVLSLSHNILRKLDNGVFFNLTFLQKLSLDNNMIESIEEKALSSLPALLNIDLAENRLTTMSGDFLDNFPKIISLGLEGNPWLCDCHLQEFRNKTLRRNLITKKTTCDAPALLQGSSWADHVVFACVPEIIEPLPSTHIEAKTSNVTLICRVRGEPQPDVNWVLVSNGKIIERDPRQSSQRFFTSKNKVGEITWNNLTITNVNYRDKGEYKCVATNPGGVKESNISLIITSSGAFAGGPLALGATLPLVIALSVLGVVILVVIVVLAVCCCRKNTHGMSSKRRDLQNSSDECIRLHGQSEIEKALITDVNPVMKPPRVCSVPPSVNSGGTEVSEAKKNLLDSDSVFAGDDESQSIEYDLQSYRKSSSLLDPDYRGNHPYPPDLLPFPPRMCQVSPAGSSASTVADTSRLPAHHGPQSPLHSPMYDSASLYRTLPYSRSQSPFVGPPSRAPRQGYVTIPRRPKPPQQRWSDAAASDAEEPMYDNLGLRTTADGSSALSLTKSEANTPKGTRLFPGIDPIAENEAPPPPPPSTAERTKWAVDNAAALRSPRTPKVAPVPPPKPKKRASAGPLFEDEGEDGTEV